MNGTHISKYVVWKQFYRTIELKGFVLSNNCPLEWAAIIVVYLQTRRSSDRLEFITYCIGDSANFVVPKSHKLNKKITWNKCSKSQRMRRPEKLKHIQY